jgi:hypothetical protein
MEYSRVYFFALNTAITAIEGKPVPGSGARYGEAAPLSIVEQSKGSKTDVAL